MSKLSERIVGLCRCCGGSLVAPPPNVTVLLTDICSDCLGCANIDRDPEQCMYRYEKREDYIAYVTKMREERDAARSD